MTPTEAETLLGQLVASWPEAKWTDDVRRAWRDELVYLDSGPAGTALVRLRRTEEKRPSIARFHDAVRALHTVTQDERKHCDRCEGTGWIEHAAGVEPCVCRRVDAQRFNDALASNTVVAKPNQSTLHGVLDTEDARAFAELGRQALERSEAEHEVPSAAGDNT